MATVTETTPPDVINQNRAYQNAWIVYINGLEVPVAAVDVSYGVWKIPQAEIVMLPDPAIPRLGAADRVTVQVFYCDQWINPKKPEFRLLFDGEIIGWNYVNVDRSRTISFTCVDYIQIFTQLFFFFMSGIDDFATGANAEMIGVNAAGVNVAGLGCLFPYSMFAEGLITPQAQGSNARSPLITRPIDYIYNVVLGFIQIDVPVRSIPACNFFSPWARRTKFNRRFLALPLLEEDEDTLNGAQTAIFPILRAVQDDFSVAALYKATASIGSSGSIWEVFENILSTVMMELVMLPAPIAVRSSQQLHVHGQVTADNEGNLKPHTGRKPVNLGNYFVKPHFLFGLPPTCNVFFPSQITSLAYQENYATQPTRMYFSADSHLTQLNQQTSSAGQAAIARTALSVAHPEDVNLVLQDALSNPGENGKNTLVYPEEFFRGPVVDRRQMPRWFTFLSDASNEGTNQSTPATEEDKAKLAQDVPPGDTARNLFKKYAGYEFAKEKYARRNGGVHMPFNPYPVPGFPCAVFDQRHTQVDVFGYVMSVRHTLSPRAMTTDVSFSYGRTVKEAFDLLRKHVSLENAVLQKERAYEADRRKNAENGDNVPPANKMERVGAIAIAPAEPIREIRDVIQSFERSEQFYKSLFHGFRDPAALKESLEEAAQDVDRNTPANNVVTRESFLGATSSQLVDQGQNVDPATQSVPADPSAEQSLPLENAAIATASESIAGDPTTTSLPPELDYSAFEQSLPDSVRPSLITSEDEKEPVWTPLPGVKKTATFRYDRVIQLTSAKGENTRIELKGMDGTTRRRLVGYIGKMRTNSATDDEIAQVTKAINALNSVNNFDFSTLRTQDELIKQLNFVEEQIQDAATVTNIQGSNVELSPTEEGALLFQSYAAAMSYNSRSICTLDEYLAFLGKDASPEPARGILPESELAADSTRAFPAKYYTYIRKYIPGPPAQLPAINQTNSTVLTSPDGLLVVPYLSNEISLSVLLEDADHRAALELAQVSTNNADETPNTAGGTDSSVKIQPIVLAIDDKFPETTEDWDAVLRIYRRNSLTRSAPGR